MKNVVVMGYTGSVGIQSLDVISKNKSHKNYMTNLEKLLGKGGASNKVANLIYTRTRA